MLHKNALPNTDDIHVIHNWEVADAAALAALAVSASDVGKVARQLDTDDYYILKNSIPTWSKINLGIPAAPPFIIPLACSDETTALTVGVAKVTFRMPKAMTVSSVRASLTTAQVSGAIFTVDIKENGVSILSTKITIDNTEKTSTTAVALPVLSDTALADDSEITIDIVQVGDGTAKGLKVYLIGT